MCNTHVHFLRGVWHSNRVDSFIRTTPKVVWNNSKYFSKNTQKCKLKPARVFSRTQAYDYACTVYFCIVKEVRNVLGLPGVKYQRRRHLHFTVSSVNSLQWCHIIFIAYIHINLRVGRICWKFFSSGSLLHVLNDVFSIISILLSISL